MTPRERSFDSIRDTLSETSPVEMRTELTTGHSPSMRHRRAIIGLSFAGMAAMGAVTMLQTGVINHLPDPPGEFFDSDAASLSDDAFDTGVPDGALAVRTLATNVPLSTLGGANRARERPWLPLASTAKSAIGAAAAGKTLSKMARGQRAWSPYLLADAAVNFGILALSLPEAADAAKTVWNWLTGEG